jgi:NarL family two-component system sensor histidine kinase LiaS
MENTFLTSAIILIVSFVALALIVIVFVLFIKKKITEKQNQHVEQLRKKELQHLTELIAIQERERKRIARNIHDQIHPLMYSLRLNLEYQLGNNEKEKSIIRLCSNIQADLAIITDQLAPRILYTYGLIKAMEIFISELVDVDAHFQTDVPPSFQFNKLASMEVYRVLLELIHNLHIHEKIAKIRLNISEDSDALLFRIEHDKPGISNTEFDMLLDSSDGLGLRSVHLRTTILGADLRFITAQQGIIELRVKKQKLTAQSPINSLALSE